MGKRARRSPTGAEDEKENISSNGSNITGLPSTTSKHIRCSWASLSYFYQLDCNFKWCRCCCFGICCFLLFCFICSFIRFSFRQDQHLQHFEIWKREWKRAHAKGANEILRLPTHYKVSFINKNCWQSSAKTRRKKKPSEPKTACNWRFPAPGHITTNNTKLKLKLKHPKINGMQNASTVWKEQIVQAIAFNLHEHRAQQTITIAIFFISRNSV